MGCAQSTRAEDEVEIRARVIAEFESARQDDAKRIAELEAAREEDAKRITELEAVQQEWNGNVGTKAALPLEDAERAELEELRRLSVSETKVGGVAVQSPASCPSAANVMMRDAIRTFMRPPPSSFADRPCSDRHRARSAAHQDR